MTVPLATTGAALERWFALLDSRGFGTGVRERLQVQTLLARLAAQGRLPATLHETLALAGPLLCSSARQQRDYASLLAAFVAQAPAPLSAGPAAGGHGQQGKPAGFPGPPLLRWWQRLLGLLGQIGVLGTLGQVGQRGALLLGLGLAALLLAAVLLLPAWHGWPGRPTGVPAATPAASAASAAPPVATASAPAAPAALPALYAPARPLPLQPALAPGWSQPLRVVLLGFGALSALGLVVWARLRRQRQMVLRGMRTDDAVQHHLLHDPAPVSAAPHPVLARAVGRALRQRVAGETQVLDLRATLRATVAAHGAVSPRWRSQQRTPEYLVLIDTRHPHDHHAAYAHMLVGALASAGVTLHLYGYDTTPAAGCWAHGASGNDDAVTRNLLPLATLASRSAQQRLLVFGSADALLNPATGAPQRWLAGLQPLAERAWITPQPMHTWGPPEQAADAAGFLVLPLQEAALATLGGWLSTGRVALALDPDTPASYPALLGGAALGWLARPDAPPQDTLDTLLLQLRRMLGGERFQWLCACAVFPALTPPLTLALGQQVVADARTLPLGLAALAALPWFRHGRMPDWLRRVLLQRLSPALRLAVDQAVRDRLDTALDATLDATHAAHNRPVLADIATRRARRTRLLAALQRRHGPLHDVVLADFLDQQADPALAQRLPDGLRRRLFRYADPAAGLRRWVLALPTLLLAAGLLAATPLWPQLVGTVPQLPLLPLSFAAATLQPPNFLGPAGLRLDMVSERDALVRSTRRPEGDFLIDLLEVGGLHLARVRDMPPDLAAMPAATGASGIRLNLANGVLRLQDAAGASIGAPLAPAGDTKSVMAASFAPSGSRVVALAADGTVVAWGRPWAGVTLELVACDDADPGAGSSKAMADRLAAAAVAAQVDVVVLRASVWRWLRPEAGAAPLPGEIRLSADSQRPLAQAISALLPEYPDAAFTGPWDIVLAAPGAARPDTVTLGVCARRPAGATPALAASAAASRTPLRQQIVLSISDERQRPLAELLRQRLVLAQLPAPVIDNIAGKAKLPAEPQLYLWGASDRQIGRLVADAAAAVLGLPVTTLAVNSQADNDRYTVWLDKDVCITRQVPGCTAASPASAVATSTSGGGADAAGVAGGRESGAALAGLRFDVFACNTLDKAAAQGADAAAAALLQAGVPAANIKRKALDEALWRSTFRPNSVANQVRTSLGQAREDTAWQALQADKRFASVRPWQRINVRQSSAGYISIVVCNAPMPAPVAPPATPASTSAAAAPDTPAAAPSTPVAAAAPQQGSSAADLPPTRQQQIDAVADRLKEYDKLLQQFEQAVERRKQTDAAAALPSAQQQQSQRPQQQQQQQQQQQTPTSTPARQPSPLLQQLEQQLEKARATRDSQAARLRQLQQQEQQTKP